MHTKPFGELTTPIAGFKGPLGGGKDREERAGNVQRGKIIP